ncbi:MAG: pilin [Patescibacteria group bacterium]
MKNFKTEKFKFKNLVYIAFAAFTSFIFSISFANFAFAADESPNCNCANSRPSCTNSNYKVISNNCASGTTCVCRARQNTGGLVPCNPTAENPDDCTAEDLFGNPNDYANKPPIWTTLIRTALGISGIFILVMFIYGGIRIMVSGGDKAKIKAATDIMKSSVVGLLIVIFAYTFVQFIVMALVQDKWRIFFGGQ